MFLLLLPNVKWDKMFSATVETLYMTAIAGIFVFILGLIIGLVLFLTAPNQLLENKWINRVLSAFVNTFSFNSVCHFNHSFIKLYKSLSWDSPWSECCFTSFNYRSRSFLMGVLLKCALREIDKGVIEASIAMGASLWTIIRKVLNS